MSKPSFIGHYEDHVGPDNCHYPNSDELLSFGAPLGKVLGLQKIGIHIEILPPGRRTSWPHAEKLEEEFVFVLEGTPDAWIDGVLHRMRPGEMAAFPSGTGIAHTFLNNTKTLVKLLVGGERIEGNRIVYPKHPARNEACREKGWLWEDPPSRELGPHDGRPDPI